MAGLNDVVSSLWNSGIEPVATFGQTSAADDVQFEGRDLSGVDRLDPADLTAPAILALAMDLQDFERAQAETRRVG